MPSNIIKFRETKEFRQTIEEARELLDCNQSDLIRILSCLGLERLKEAFKSLEGVSQPLKMTETQAFASSVKIHILKAKKQQLKEL